MNLFHSGEQRLQARVGLAERLGSFSSKIVLSELPEQHQQFYPLLPLVFVATADQKAQPWASVLCGIPGFVHAVDAKHLRIHALPNSTDRLWQHLQKQAAVGVLGLEFPTRRRNRANGKISTLDESGFTVQVEQCFGNCPKYIQTRTPSLVQRPATTSVSITEQLNAQQQDFIQQADTFFIASVWENAVDISHRGRGNQTSLINVEDEQTLYLPDFAGNNYFNTFGNLLLNPQAGLLFIDFTNGDLLHLAATVEIIWQEHQRGLRLHIHEVHYRPQALAIAWDH